MKAKIALENKTVYVKEGASLLKAVRKVAETLDISFEEKGICREYAVSLTKRGVLKEMHPSQTKLTGDMSVKMQTVKKHVILSSGKMLKAGPPDKKAVPA